MNKDGEGGCFNYLIMRDLKAKGGGGLLDSSRVVACIHSAAQKFFAMKGLPNG
jgi:hypothetical protein